MAAGGGVPACTGLLGCEEPILRIDLESQELNVETEGLDKLFQATKGLYERLAPLFRKDLA